MNIQKASEENSTINTTEQKTYPLQSLIEHANLQNLFFKKYFTEIGLISDYFHLVCEFCFSKLAQKRGFKFQIQKKQIDEQCQVVVVKMGTTESQLVCVKIVIIQMERVIKVTIKHLKQEEKPQKQVVLDSFWFDHQIYLNSKVSNVYKLSSLKQLNATLQPKSKNVSQLNYLIISRVFHAMVQSLRSINLPSEARIITEFDNLNFFKHQSHRGLGQKFYESLAVSQNFIKICGFLNIRSILNLKLVSRFLKGYFFRSEKLLFKSLYQYNYGKSGFEIDQMDWAKLLKNKRSQKTKQKPSHRLIILNPNQGVFRTH